MDYGLHDSMQAFHAHLNHALANSCQLAVAECHPLSPRFEGVFYTHFNKTLATMPFVSEDPTRLYSTKCIAIAYAANATIRDAQEEARTKEVPLPVLSASLPQSRYLH
jgi:hypothetical protein